MEGIKAQQRAELERIIAECTSDDSYVWVPDTRSIPTEELDAPEHR